MAVAHPILGRAQPVLPRFPQARYFAMGGWLHWLCSAVPAIGMLGVQLIAQPYIELPFSNGFAKLCTVSSNCRLATNIVPLGLVIVGEGLHNNHQAFPHLALLPSAAGNRWCASVHPPVRGLGLLGVCSPFAAPT